MFELCFPVIEDDKKHCSHSVLEQSSVSQRGEKWNIRNAVGCAMIAILVNKTMGAIFLWHLTGRRIIP